MSTAITIPGQIDMPESDKWLSDYGDSHTKISNPAIYWVAVLLLVVATVGLFWSLPVPVEFVRISPVLNWGSAFLMATMVYYFIISVALAIGMLPFVFGVGAIQIWVSQSGYNIAPIASFLFATSLVGIILGRYGSGGTKAVLEDIQMMMIAPVWLLSNVYRRIGIPY